MTKRLNHKFILSFVCLFIFLFSCFFVVGSGVSAKTEAQKELYGLNETAKEGYGKNSSPGYTKEIPERIGTIVGAALAFVGVLFFILMIYGGFLWMTAQGNEQQVEKAKTLIISAVIGIIIVMSAYAITAYIGTTLTS